MKNKITEEESYVLHMEQIQEYGYSLYYIQNNKIIEFNLMSKIKRMHRDVANKKCIFKVLDRNLIGYKINKRYFLNNLFLSTISYSVFVLQDPCGDKYIGIDEGYLKEMAIYDMLGNFRKKINRVPHADWVVSRDGKIIAWTKFGSLYKLYIYSLNCNLELDIVTLKHKGVNQRLICLINGFRLVENGDGFFWKKSSTRIINIKTGAIMKINTKGVKYYDTNHDIMLGLGPANIKIYDANKLSSVTEINHKYKFIHYHKTLDILITENLQFFKITSNYKLIQVNIGINYIMDSITHPIMIMEIISQCNLFDILPPEFVFIELYQMLLKYVIASNLDM